MVVNYLKKNRDYLLKQKVHLSEAVSSYENQLKENIQFVQMLEETSDPNYEAFSPREVNSFNRKKIVELLEERENITNRITQLQIQLSELDYNIDEINSVIKVAKENDSNAEKSLYDIDSNMKLTILKTVERDRQRIARDLHDSITQNITSLVHKTELCTKLIEADPIRCRLELFSVNKSLRDIIEEMRRLIYDLRPMSFDDIGFDVTLERTLDKFRAQKKVKFNFQVCGDTYEIDNLIQLTLIRVIQEACNNAIKHSEASKLDVTLTYEKKRIILNISDDGKGFDTDSLAMSFRDDNSGFGISIMRERVYLLSGSMEIQSSPGNGCHITVSIPLIKEEV